MSVKIMIEELHRLYGLHEQLLKLSKNKTEMLKNNEIDALSEVLNKVINRRQSPHASKKLQERIKKSLFRYMRS
jgi:signal transduction histidine kinase